MTALLDKTRRINRLLQRPSEEIVNFKEVAKVLSDIIDTNVYVISRRGKILGHGLRPGFECEILEQQFNEEGRVSEDYNRQLLKTDNTTANIPMGDECSFGDDITCPQSGKLSTIVPIVSGGERLGTLFLSRPGKEFVDDDLLLAEYAAVVVGLEILHSQSSQIEEEARKKAGVQLAIGTLSYSELEAVEHIFRELNNKEGLLVASKIADRVGITRSVIVNALRKLESAGVIESRSLGMKGTYIKILNDRLMDELKNR